LLLAPSADAQEIIGKLFPPGKKANPSAILINRS